MKEIGGGHDGGRRHCRNEDPEGLVKGELYRRMLGGVLSRCVGQEEA